MNIKVEIKKTFKGERPVKAFADVVIDGSMVIHGVAVIEKDGNKLVSMPYKKWKTGEGEQPQGTLSPYAPYRQLHGPHTTLSYSRSSSFLTNN